MKPFTFAVLAFLFAAIPFSHAQQRGEYEIKKVEVSFVDTPAYTVSPPARQVRAKKWMQIEVSFDSKADFTEELVFNYYIYFTKRLFVGRVHHVTIQKGRDLHSVAYMSPNAIADILRGKQLSPADVENVSVTITKPGIAAPISAKSWKPSTGEWWATMKQEEGFVVDKSQTPFAPLAWDYYEALKPTTTR